MADTAVPPEGVSSFVSVARRRAIDNLGASLTFVTVMPLVPDAELNAPMPPVVVASIRSPSAPLV